MALTCAWRDARGRWHRSPFHIWRSRTYTKVCARCGQSRTRVF